MPIYKFRCPSGHVTEHHFSTDAVPTIAVCDCGQNAQRRFSPDSSRVTADVPSCFTAQANVKQRLVFVD